MLCSIGPATLADGYSVPINFRFQTDPDIRMSLRPTSRSDDGIDSANFRPRGFSAHFNPLAVAFTFVVVIVMFGLGALIIKDYRMVQTQSYGEVGSVYIDNLIAPYALANFGESTGEDPSPEQITLNLAEARDSLLLRVWKPDGTLLYSSFESDIDQHDSAHLNKAIAGGSVTELVTSGKTDAGFPLAFPFFEVYAPIHDPGTGEMIAVGEVYTDASEALRDRWHFERTVWTGLIFATLGVLAMLALSFSQSAQIQARLNAERRIAKQNERLRKEADQVRLDALNADEQILNLVAAELHDGPVQLLGLISLMRGENAPSKLADGSTVDSLIDQVMTELRGMSAGLILPELDGLDAKAVVELAVERHRMLTGGEADLNLDVPIIRMCGYRRICLYRIVQEGLMNAVHHGGDATPSVSMTATDGALKIAIRNRPSDPAEIKTELPTWHLGLNGMRRRLDAFGGALVFENTPSEIRLCVTLPLETPLADTPSAIS